MGEVYATLFNDITINQYPAAATATFFTLPLVFLKMTTAICFFQCATNTGLQVQEIVFYCFNVRYIIKPVIR